MLKIRLARGGAKKRPYYRIVIANVTSPRDGKFLEKIGTYNPLLSKDDENRIKIDVERLKYWVSVGAKPTDRISRMPQVEAVLGKVKQKVSVKKALPKKKSA